MKKTIYFPALLLITTVQFSAQEKAIDTVFIFDRQLSQAKKTQQIYRLSAKDIQRNANSLSETLRFQTPVYIKENGRGAVSSPSFRGTTAQQTAVLWNGIPVNSIFPGQGDLNNLSLLNYDNIEVKPGGGSVIYGSAAIGGTIHLNNQITFNKGFSGKLFAEYGSFETLNTALKTSYSNEKFSAVFSTGYSTSKNEYEVPEKNYINRNGQYENLTFNLSSAYRFSEKNEIYWHTQHFSGEQHFPVFEITQTKTKYATQSLRSLVSWKNSGAKHQNILSAAFLREGFSYFANVDNTRETGGDGQTFFFKNDFTYSLPSEFRLNVITQAINENGKGYHSGIQNPERWAGSAAVLIQYEKEKLFLEAGAKKEFVESISAPFLYSLGGNYRFNPAFLLKLKGSKNFRYPSFNDLYWQPGGNLNLKPEISYQAEITPEFSYKNFRLSVTPYYNRIFDMIRWLPTSSGFWAPANTDEVQAYGVETVLNYNQKKGKHQFSGNIGYAFTKSENVETGFQLSYVPLHKAFGMIRYQHNPFEFFVQGIFNGRTFTTTDESEKDSLDPYFVVNAGIAFNLLDDWSLGFKIQNITDTIYETTAFYPLPKRNYSMNLTLNF